MPHALRFRRVGSDLEIPAVMLDRFFIIFQIIVVNDGKIVMGVRVLRVGLEKGLASSSPPTLFVS